VIHVSQTNLIKLAAGELPPEARRELEAHIARCEACRRAFDDLRDVYHRLGDWPVNVAGHDTWPAVESSLRNPFLIRPAWARTIRLSRVAAVIVIGTGLGYTAGWLAKTEPAATPGEANAVASDDALAALGFDAIESPSATGLYVVITPEEDGARESEDTL